MCAGKVPGGPLGRRNCTPPNTCAARIITRLNEEILKAMASPEVSDNLLDQGMEPTPTTPEELGTYIRSETEKWAQIIKERNISAD